MKRIGVKVDGVMLLTLLALGAGTYVYINRKKVLKKINPASDQNFIYQSDLVQGSLNTRDERGYTLGDKIFASIDLLNPFNESDDYAKKVHGIDNRSLEESLADPNLKDLTWFGGR